jgi:hypothetical protein
MPFDGSWSIRAGWTSADIEPPHITSVVSASKSCAPLPFGSKVMIVSPLIYAWMWGRLW